MKHKEAVGEDGSLPGEITTKLDSLTAEDLLTVLTEKPVCIGCHGTRILWLQVVTQYRIRARIVTTLKL